MEHLEHERLTQEIADKDEIIYNLRCQIKDMEADHKGEIQDLHYEIDDLRGELRAALDELYDTQNGAY